jgi:hypothetical protein
VGSSIGLTLTDACPMSSSVALCLVGIGMGLGLEIRIGIEVRNNKAACTLKICGRCYFNESSQIRPTFN